MFKAIVMVTGMRIRNILVDQSKVFNIKGSNVEGKDVTLDAKENLNITASETTNKLEQDSKSSSASVGVGFDLATGQVSSVTISGSKSKGEVDANSTSYNESTIKADKNLDFTSGKDTNIKGGKLSGEKVTGNVGGDLNIESKQDHNSYEEKNSSGNVIKEYNKDALSKEITEMILKEAAKGYTMYRVGKIAENRGIPKAVIITAQVGTIVVSNFVSY